MRPLRRLLSALLLSLAACLPAAAQSVHGRLLDEDRGQPVARARLTLISEAGATVDSTFTDASGRFRLKAPRAGTYGIFFELDGWASNTSDLLQLAAAPVAYDFRVRLVSNEALRDMSDIMSLEPRLQEALPKICGEAFRPWEAGLLVGRVRAGPKRTPVAGARVSVGAVQGAAPRATVTNENGIYVLCNVPTGAAIPIITETPAGARETTIVEIRAGMASWYDLFVVPRAR